MPCIDAAMENGAHAAYLSGAGPTVCALTSGAAGDVFAQKSYETLEVKIAEAMHQAAEKAGISGRSFVTTPSQQGMNLFFLLEENENFEELLLRRRNQSFRRKQSRDSTHLVKYEDLPLETKVKTHGIHILKIFFFWENIIHLLQNG